MYRFELCHVTSQVYTAGDGLSRTRGSFSLPQTLNDLRWPDIPSCYNVPDRRLLMYIFFYKLSPAFSKKIRGDACKLTAFCVTWFVAPNPLTYQ